MANELRHIDVGTSLTEAEWEGIDSHQFQGQATGDVLYASSASQLSRLGIGSDTEVLTLASGIPSWAAIPAAAAGSLTGTTLVATVVTSSLTTVGTIGTGLWQGTAVTEVYGGTGQTTWTTGDVPYASGSNTLAKLGIGSSLQQLRVSAGGIPEWFTATGGGVTTGKAIAMAIVF